MAIEKEKFFEIIKNVNEGGGLNKDNLLEKIKDELYEVERKLPEEDCGEYNKFKNDLWKDHLFSVKTSNGPVDYTLLHLAVESNNVLMVKLLIKKTVRVDMRIKDGSSNGLTALHIAASHGYEEIVQLLLDANANPSLEDSQDRIPREMVETIDNIQNREIIIKRLEEAEKNYSPKKAKDLNIKIEGGGHYHLSQNNHKTQASLAVNENDAAATNGIDSYSERCDATCDDETSSNDSGTYTPTEGDTREGLVKHVFKGSGIEELENELRELHEKNTAVVNFSSKRERELNAQLNRLTQEKKDLESKVEKLSREVDWLKEQQTNTQRQLDDTLKKLKDSRIRKLESSDEELRRVEQKLEEAQKDLETLKDHLAKNETKQEALNKLDEENKSLKQEIINLKSENATFKGKLEEAESQHSNYIAEHEAKLGALNKLNEENKLLKQKIEDLKSENATLNSELEKNKNQHSQTSEVSLKKVEKKPPLSKIAYVSLVATLIVGSILSIVSGLFVLSMIATSVTSALVAGGITYTMLKPTTELKEVNIQSPNNNKACEI
ncbi:MAG: ankyrin repeat domain-containing protein [Rickettsiales bacterium]|nr:ankyrin repeat domain-containing protein [Rickettsiales bacterium]MDR1261464.1 ankyrin repeat domain-containing protein [Rickettsiales bacterium]